MLTNPPKKFLKPVDGYPIINSRMFDNADEPTKLSYFSQIISLRCFYDYLTERSIKFFFNPFLSHLLKVLQWGKIPTNTADIDSFVENLPPHITLVATVYVKRHGVRYKKIIIEQPTNLKNRLHRFVLSLQSAESVNDVDGFLYALLSSVRFRFISQQQDVPELSFDIDDFLKPFNHYESLPTLISLFDKLGILHECHFDDEGCLVKMSDSVSALDLFSTHVVLVASQNALLHLLSAVCIHRLVKDFPAHLKPPKGSYPKKLNIRPHHLSLAKLATYDACKEFVTLYMVACDFHQSTGYPLDATLDQMVTDLM